MAVKWVLLTLALTTGQADDACNGPLPLVRHSNELYDTEAECAEAWQTTRFYKSTIKQQLVGVCVQGRVMYLSPKQIDEKEERPKCP